MIGLYNPNPDGKQVLPSYGPPLVIGAIVAGVAFLLWERFSRTRLINPAGVRFVPLLSALGVSVCAGAALMVTLVNVELFGQGVLQMDQTQAAGLLLWFLIALPIGAVLGGWIATRTGDRAVTFVGLLVAAYGYWLIHYWRADLIDRHHSVFGLFSVPVLHTDLLVAGVGLGLVIGPVSSAALRVVPAAQHGIASAAVVVARNTGMLIGVAALSAWGLYRVQPHLGEKDGRDPSRREPARPPAPPEDDVSGRLRGDVWRHLRGHRVHLCGRCASGPVARRPKTPRGRARRTRSSRTAARNEHGTHGLNH